MRILLLVLLCSTLILAIDDEKSKETTAEKSTETSTKEENPKEETVRIKLDCFDTFDVLVIRLKNAGNINQSHGYACTSS